MGEIGEYWRDVKDAKKQQALENPPPQRCRDWILTSGCHYARNRSSFKTYRKIHRPEGSELRIIGVGTVELEVEKDPQSKETGTMILHNVVHVPTAICNGFNPMNQQGEGLGGSMSWGGEGAKGLDNGTPVWYAKEFHGLQRLVLAGNVQGESYMEDGKTYSLSMFLTAEEQEALNM